MKTARIQVNGDTDAEKHRFVVICEEVSQGVRIELKVRHYASLKAAERAAAKYTGAA
jgi:predicted RNA-binding protein with TRAM domain